MSQPRSIGTYFWLHFACIDHDYNITSRKKIYPRQTSSPYAKDAYVNGMAYAICMQAHSTESVLTAMLLPRSPKILILPRNIIIKFVVSRLYNDQLYTRAPKIDKYGGVILQPEMM
jgi:hypothetical protein